MLLLVGIVTLAFNIPPAKAWTGTVYIRDDGSIDPPEARALMETFDNVTYTLTGNVMSDGDGIVVERDNIIIDGRGYIVEGAETYESKGICLVACNNVTVKNVKVTKFTFGIYLVGSLSNNISDNLLIGNGFGVYLYSSIYNNIYGNIVTNNYWGIWLDCSLNNTLLKNEVIKNDRHGIELFGSSNNTLQENDVMKNGWDGINLETLIILGTIINETSNNYILRNNLVKNGWKSIELSNSNHNRISENNIIESGYISLSNSNHNKISRNNMIRNVYGILLDSSSNNTILENKIIESSLSGVWLTNSPSNYLMGNTFVGCGLIIYSCDLFFRDSHVSDNNTVKDNFVNSKPLVYLENVSNYTVTDAGQVILVNCSNVRVENLNLSKASEGILLWKTNNSIIANNIITNNWVCIDLCHSHNNTIFKNMISTNFGTQSINTELGIILEHSNYNQIIKNNMTKCSYGIWLSASQNNFILRNNIENHIDFRESSNNSVIGNNIVNSSISLNDYSSNNRIYHNNFIASNIMSCTPENLWDDGYPSGGNYWSTYTGTDTNSDGMGDTPYDIYPPPYVIGPGPKCIDRHPFMAPISTFDAGTWNEIEYFVDVVSNSTVSGFQFDVDQKNVSFNVTGDDGTAGFCRVTIPVDLLWVDDGWTITVGDQSITDYRIIPDGGFAYLYFSYNHSTQTLIIQGTHVIPEFPTNLILPLFIATTLAVAIIYRKKQIPKLKTI
jgi:parallel beta-helix repeat protein